MPRPAEAARAPTRFKVALAAGMVLFAVATTSTNWVRYESLRSTWPYDLGYFNNDLFNLVNGRTTGYFFVTAWFDPKEHDGPSVFRTTHFFPLQNVVLPLLYRVSPSMLTLLLFQGVLVGLGALPLFWLVAGRTGEPRLGLLVALSYLLHPAILDTAINDYRAIALGLPLALFALWFHAARRPLWFVASSVLMLSARDEYALLLPFFGLINWRLTGARERSLRWILAPVLIALLWAGLAHAYYLAAYGRSWPVVGYAVGSQELVEAGLDPLARLALFFRIGLLPAGLGLLTPEALVVGVPFFAAAREVGWPDFPYLHFQHLSPVLVVVFWAFGCAVVWLRRGVLRAGTRAPWLERALAAAAVLSFVPFGWGAAGTYFFSGSSPYEVLDEIDNSLPMDATIVVPMQLSARFSHHTRVLVYEHLPVGTKAPLAHQERTALAERLFSVSDLVAVKRGDLWANETLAGLGRFRPGRTVGEFRIFVARSDAPRPADPDAALQRILRWDQMSPLEWKWAKDPG